MMMAQYREHDGMQSQDGSLETSQSNPSTEEPSRKKRRVQVKVACDACRRRRIRCGGERPFCAVCRASDRTEQCGCDTQEQDESRATALRRENQILREYQTSLGNAFKNLRDMPEEQALSFLDRVRKTSDPLAALISMPIGLSTASELPEQRTAQAVTPTQTRLEYELMSTYGLAYQFLEPIDTYAFSQDFSWSLLSWDGSNRLRSGKR